MTNKKYALPMNLQLFADEVDDVILPDDFDTEPQGGEMLGDEQNEGIESVETPGIGEDTKPPIEGAEGTQGPQTTPQKIKIKYNHEEREIDVEEAAALAQKGLNYEKAIERARQEAAQKARDEVIASMGMTWNGKPITTEAEYKQALAEQELINKYSDLPDEVRQELLESRRDREERQREKREREEAEKRQAAFNEFFDYFKAANDREFDPQKDVIPLEVQEAVQKGVPLKYAYMEYHNKELRNQLKIAKQNQTNLKKAPVGSVTAGGSAKTESEDPFLIGFDEED